MYPTTQVRIYSESKIKQNIYVFFGTRPEVIKLSQVLKEFSRSPRFNLITVFTGQHPHLIKPFLNIFDIKVDIWLNNTFVKNQPLTELIGRLLLNLSDQVTLNETDIWIVQGDTTTTLAVALLAFHNGIRIAHVEAGLRTFNMYSPFPEEFNRKTISSISTFHFAPTENNRQHLVNEGIPTDHIFITGNTVIDAVKYLHENKKCIIPHSLENIDISNRILILLTLHRRENILFMSELYSAIASFPCIKCLYIVPVHPNPKAGTSAKHICKLNPNKFFCVPPLSFEELHWVMNQSHVILTDSGGLQEEATWYHTPTLVLRENTERPEAVNAGVAYLVGKNIEILEQKLEKLLNSSSQLWKSMSRNIYPFGYGNSSKKIYDIITSHINMSTRNVILNPPTVKNMIFSKPNHQSVCVVLQVFKRNTISEQLKSIFKQSLVPSTVLILQNGYYLDISKVLDTFRIKYPNVQIIHITSSTHLRFHERFHLAFMMKESFVSVWDDDALPEEQWIEYCINYSISHNYALIGAKGRTFIKIENNKIVQKEFYGENDFVAHTWTLLRENLKFYVTSQIIRSTQHISEDVQLSFALQKVGIKSIKPPYEKNKSAFNTKEVTDRHSSRKTDQAPRELLFCKILKYGFKTLKCSNCHETKTLNDCIKHYKLKGHGIENNFENVYLNENSKIA